MLISHKHKFVFAKSIKVGGTSIQKALQSLCGPDDLLINATPIGKLHQLPKEFVKYHAHSRADKIQKYLGVVSAFYWTNSNLANSNLSLQPIKARVATLLAKEINYFGYKF